MKVNAVLHLPVEITLPSDLNVEPEVINFDSTQSFVVIDMTAERKEKFTAFPNIIVMTFNGSNKLEPYPAPIEAEPGESHIPISYKVNTSNLNGLIILKK